MATPPPSRKRQRHQHSRHRSTSTDERSRSRIRRGHRSSSTDERSRGRIWRRHRSTSRDERARDRIRRRHRDTHLRRGRSCDKHSRHRTRSRRHDSSSRPRYTSYHRLERRNRRDSPIVQYDRLCPLLLYKHFINGLDVNILPDEAHRRYEPYLPQLKQAFFAAHKDDQRLKHLYHPSHIQTAIHKRNENAKAVAKNFFQDLKNGTLVYLKNCSPKNAVRHLKDLNQARSLIAKVDAEKGIEDNLLLSSGQDGSFAQFIPVKKPDDSITTLAGIELLNLRDMQGIPALQPRLPCRIQPVVLFSRDKLGEEPILLGRKQKIAFNGPLCINLGNKEACLVNFFKCLTTFLEEQFLKNTRVPFLRSSKKFFATSFAFSFRL